MGCGFGAAYRIKLFGFKMSTGARLSQKKKKKIRKKK